MVSWQSRFLERSLRSASRAPIDYMAPFEKLRGKYETIARKYSKLSVEVDVIPVSTGRTEAEWIEPPSTQPHRVILFFHGGGYCTGSLDTHRNLLARLCEASSARGLSVDYRLAPESKFPAAVEDALDAYQWLLGQGIDPKGIVMAGDSSGGGLAIATAMALRDANAPQPAGIVAMSPWVDLAIAGWSALTHQRQDPALTLELLNVMSRHYLQGKSPTEPLASPLYGDFRGLPPILMHVGSNEVLKDDATRLAQAAEKAGVDVSIEVFDGMPHAFQLYSVLPEAKGSIARLGSFIKTRTIAIATSRKARPVSPEPDTDAV